QSGPSFDCKRAKNEVELAICATPDLATADRQMAAAYAALLAKLSGPARQHLLKDQEHWLAIRNDACAGTRDEVIDCINRRTAARIINLRVFGDGLYPFISEQALIKNGKVGKIFYSIDASWPRFDGTSADFSAVNSEFATRTAKAAQEVIPPDTSAGELRG